MGAVAKSYMRRPLVIYDFATAPKGFPYIYGKFIFFFISAVSAHPKSSAKVKDYKNILIS
jgi:hypothetical protein